MKQARGKEDKGARKVISFQKLGFCLSMSFHKFVHPCISQSFLSHYTAQLSFTGTHYAYVRMARLSSSERQVTYQESTMIETH